MNSIDIKYKQITKAKLLAYFAFYIAAVAMTLYFVDEDALVRPDLLRWILIGGTILMIVIYSYGYITMGEPGTAIEISDTELKIYIEPQQKVKLSNIEKVSWIDDKIEKRVVIKLVKPLPNTRQRKIEIKTEFLEYDAAQLCKVINSYIKK